MSIGSARRPYAVVTSARLAARPRFGGNETMRCCAQLALAGAAVVLGSIALVQMLDLALDCVHAWIE